MICSFILRCCPAAGEVLEMAWTVVLRLNCSDWSIQPCKQLPQHTGVAVTKCAVIDSHYGLIGVSGLTVCDQHITVSRIHFLPLRWFVGHSHEILQQVFCRHRLKKYNAKKTNISVHSTVCSTGRCTTADIMGLALRKGGGLVSVRHAIK